LEASLSGRHFGSCHLYAGRTCRLERRTMTDEILEEVYAARKKIAEQCNYDFEALIMRYEQMQAENPEGLVSEVLARDSEPLRA
jgi:hypothetical protein